MWKSNAHYLRITLVKPLCLPGLEDESLPRKDQIPCETVLALPYTWHTGFRGESRATWPSKPSKVTSWETWAAAVCLVQGWEPVSYDPSSLSPSHSEPAWLLQPQQELLLQVSTGRSSNPTFWQVPPFKTNKPITSHPPQTLVQANAPQYNSIPMTSSSSLAQEAAKHIWCCDSFLWFLCHFYSLPLFLAYTSLSALPWVEDKVKYAPELKFQFTSWIWNQAEYQLSKTNLSGYWNNYFSSNFFFVCLK